MVYPVYSRHNASILLGEFPDYWTAKMYARNNEGYVGYPYYK